MHMDNATKTAKTIWLLLFLFTTPYIIAAGLIKYKDRLTITTTQHGKLLTPPMQLNINNSKLWQLAYLPDSNTSRQQLIKNLHIALGVDKSRVELKLIPRQATNTQTANTMEELKQFPKGSIFITDPLGNTMLHYPPNVDLMGVLKDLRKLLKYSRIG